ncbi:MAG: hypothetical protein U0795_13175 [Pirellulales bacterium]
MTPPYQLSDQAIGRYTELLAGRREKFVVVEGKIFRPYSRMAVPLGPASSDYTIATRTARQIIRQLACPLARWTNGFHPESATNGWYSVICREFIPTEKLKAKYRSEIVRGLNNCTVRPIDADYLAHHGHAVYASAAAGYGLSPQAVKGAESFVAEHQVHARFDDIVHNWGVFAGDRLIGYSTNYVFDREEVFYSVVKFDPAHLRLYPSYALFYTMNGHYLRDQQFQYVNDGFRSILHDTSIQEYLIKKFNFHQAFTHLSVQYSPLMSAAMKVLFPAQRLVRRFDHRFDALFELERIRRLKH